MSYILLFISVSLSVVSVIAAAVVRHINNCQLSNLEDEIRELRYQCRHDANALYKNAIKMGGKSIVCQI